MGSATTECLHLMFPLVANPTLVRYMKATWTLKRFQSQPDFSSNKVSHACLRHRHSGMSSLPGDYELCLRAPSSGETPPSTLQADIVFVHGINGDPLQTWVFEEKGVRVDWTSDPGFLPTRFPHTRIFTFKWNASMLHYNSDADIKHIANNLLSSLAKQRKHHHEQYRKVIFVCHSLGGLVVQRALTLKTSERANLQHVQHATIGIIFLATPHGGSSLANLARRLLWLADSPMSLLELLSTDSTSLTKVTRQFTSYYVERRATREQGVEPLSIVSFGEMHGTPILPFWKLQIVPLQRSRLHLDGEIFEPVYKDHRSIARFRHANDPVLGKIVDHIEAFISKAEPLPPSQTLERRDKLYDLPEDNERFSGQDEYLERISSYFATPGGDKHLAVCGQRGIGKTDLVKHYANIHRHEYDVVKWFDASDVQSLRFQLETFYDDLSKAQSPILKAMPLDDQTKKCATVRAWFEKQERCLIVYDNVDANTNPKLRDYFPQRFPAHRIVIGANLNQNINELANYEIEVKQMTAEDAVKLFRTMVAHITDDNSSETNTFIRKIVVDELGRMPFYISLAARNFRQSQESLSEFHRRISEQKEDLGLQNSELAAGDGSAIWSMVYNDVRAQPASFLLLKLFAFLDGFGIRGTLLERFWSDRLRWGEDGEEMVRTALDDGISPQLCSVLQSREAFSDALAPLLAATFIHRRTIGIGWNAQVTQIEMQPLVQQFVLRMMSSDEQFEWMQTVIRLVSHAVAEDAALEPLKHWPSLIPHVLKCHRMAKSHYALRGAEKLKDIHEALVLMLLSSVGASQPADHRGMLDLTDNLLRYRSTVAQRCKATKWRSYFWFLGEGKIDAAEVLLAERQQAEQNLLAQDAAHRTPKNSAAIADVVMHRAQCLFAKGTGSYPQATLVLQSWGPVSPTSRLEVQSKRLIDTAINKNLIFQGPDYYEAAQRGLESILSRAGSQQPWRPDDFNWATVTLGQLYVKTGATGQAIGLVSERILRLEREGRVCEFVIGDLRLIHAEALLSQGRHTPLDGVLAKLKADLERPEQKSNNTRAPQQLRAARRLRARALYVRGAWPAAKDAWLRVLELLGVDEDDLVQAAAAGRVDPSVATWTEGNNDDREEVAQQKKRWLPSDYDTAEAILSLALAYLRLGDTERAAQYRALATRVPTHLIYPSGDIDYSGWLKFVNNEFAALGEVKPGRRRRWRWCVGPSTLRIKNRRNRGEERGRYRKRHDTGTEVLVGKEIRDASARPLVETIEQKRD